MIFHTRKPRGSGFGPGTTEQGEYRTRVTAVVGAIIAIILLFLAGFALWKLGWTDGSNRALHFADVVFGGVFGLFFGERSAISAK